MKLKPIGKNQTVLETENKVILFSYETPVVVEYNGKIYIPTTKFSATTTRHIKKYLRGRRAEKIEHKQLLQIAETNHKTATLKTAPPTPGELGKEKKAMIELKNATPQDLTFLRDSGYSIFDQCIMVDGMPLAFFYFLCVKLRRFEFELE